MKDSIITEIEREIFINNICIILCLISLAFDTMAALNIGSDWCWVYIGLATLMLIIVYALNKKIL